VLYKAEPLVSSINGNWYYYRNNLFIKRRESEIIQHYPTFLSLPCRSEDPTEVIESAERLLRVLGCEFNLYSMTCSPDRFTRSVNREKAVLPITLLTIGGKEERFVRFKNVQGFLMSITQREGQYRLAHFPTGILFSINKTIRGLDVSVDALDLLRVLGWRKYNGIKPSPHCLEPYMPESEYVEECEEI